MEVKIVSKEIINPSSPTVHNQEPHKLCIFDQLLPITYISVVLFYPNISKSLPKYDISKILAHLKKSLSETLNLYYPFSGRIKNNLFLEDFDAGVLFWETEVDIRMSEYFKLKDTESLNQLVPFTPLCKESGPEAVPLLAFQANVFACGAVALGTSFCHKVADGASMSYFLRSWAALSRGKTDDHTNPSLSTAAALFPPEKVLPNRAQINNVWFEKDANYLTRRFVFDAKSVETLIQKAKSEGAPTNPTRHEAVSGFLWKRTIEASRAVSRDYARISACLQAVNLRPRMTKLRPDHQLDGAIGNLMWFASALSSNCGGAKEVEFARCVAQVRRSLGRFNSEFAGVAMEGGGGSLAVMRNFRDMMAVEPEDNPDTVMITNWKGFYNDLDFGWGKPFWVGPAGKTGPEFRDFVTMIDSRQFPKGSIEAFVSMEDNKIAVLEKDEELLKFASLNPDFPTLF